jgi:hypothetical protein
MGGSALDKEIPARARKRTAAVVIIKRSITFSLPPGKIAGG